MCRWLIAAGKRPVPFRTRKLSPPAPMVLPPGGGGRVGYRRPNNFTPTPATHQPRCAAGVFASPLPQQPANTTTPHRGHCKHLHTPQRGLLGVQGSSAPLLQHRYLLADTATPHCRHRRHLDTPQPGLVGRQGWHGLIADTPRTKEPGVIADSCLADTSISGKSLRCCGLDTSALQTSQVPTNSAMWHRRH